MYQIKINRKALKISEAELRLLSTLSNNNWAAKKAEFVDGFEIKGSSPRYQNSILPRDSDRCRLLGIKEVWKESAKSQREKQFFIDHPRCYSGIFGSPRRIKAILEKIEIAWLLQKTDKRCRLCEWLLQKTGKRWDYYG